MNGDHGLDDTLEQDNYYDTTPTTTPSIPSSVGEYNEDSLPNHLDYFFWMKWLLRSCNFMEDFFSKSGHLGLFEA